MRRLLILVCSLGSMLALPRAAAAQDPVLRPDTMLTADTIPQEFAAPRAAFVRALLVPGWGHLHLREPRRAAVYATLQTTSWFMLVKTLVRLDEVRDRERGLSVLARDSLAFEMARDTALARELADPDRYDTALLTFPGLRNARGLKGAREQQRQDWIVYTTFFTFIAAVDAYVTAHLQDFPADITASRSADGGMGIGVRMPTGTRR